MSQNNWRCYIYEISDTLKYALGEYCLSLYKASGSTKNYLAKVIGLYRGVNNRPISASHEHEFLKQTETRIWLRLIKKDLDTRLASFVQDPTQRSLAETYLTELIGKYNAVYHQQELDYAEACATAKKTLQLLELTDTRSGTIETAIRSIEHIINKMDESYSGVGIVAHRQNGSKHQANGNSPAVVNEAVQVSAHKNGAKAEDSLPEAEWHPLSSFDEADEEAEQPYTELIQACAQYTVLVQTPDNRRIEKVICKDEFIIGRSHKADLTLDDPFTSLQHIKICYMHEQVYVIDMGSKNGTTMNNTKIASGTPMLWRIEQPIKIGHTRLSLTWTT